MASELLLLYVCFLFYNVIYKEVNEMNPSIFPSIIKTFFILLCSIYSFGKIINTKITKKKYSLFLLFSFLASPIIHYIQTIIPLPTVFTITLLAILFCFLLFRQSFSRTIYISVLSIGSNYVIFIILLIIMIPIIFLLVTNEFSRHLTETILLVLAGLLQTILSFLLFRTKRLRAGIPTVINAFESHSNIFTAILSILFSSCFYFDKDVRNTAFNFLLVTFVLALGIITWLDWQKTIQTDYINKNNTRQIDFLEDTLQERDAELERLSKIIHKDNKLLAALELSTREILTDASSEKAQSLLQELNRFSQERSETLHAYEPGQVTLPETGLFSVDTMIRYLHQRALKHKIDFQLNLEGKIAGITDVISEEDLRTIIADLGENAIIATRESEVKNIRLSLERKTDGYALYFYDSGEPFAAEVLENFGKQRCTTHAETGGSGIGLVTTSELVTKYQGEFYITDEDILKPYIKCVVVLLKQRR